MNGGSSIVQKVVLYGLPGGNTTASYNGNDGLRINGVSNGGSVQQQVGVYYSSLYGNTGNGIEILASATATTAPALKPRIKCKLSRSRSAKLPPSMVETKAQQPRMRASMYL